MRSFYLLLCVCIVTGASAQTKELSVIGSSTSACTGPDFYTDCYIGRLDAHYDPVDIHQLAVGGYTVYKGMPSSFTGPRDNLQPDPNNNITRALSFMPDVVIVNYPSNGYDTLRVDSIMRCLRTIRDSANALGVPCYITTTQPRHAFPFNTMAARTKLKEIRDSIMLQFGYFAIDFWTDLADPATYNILPAYDDGDGIHLNEAGHEILFQRVVAKNIFLVELPVKLSSFTVKPVQNQVAINWIVKDEEIGTRYEVQRGADAISFETIHSVTSSNTAASRSYQAIDRSASGGVLYYRLKVTENAKSFYSAVQKISIGKNKLSLQSFSMDALRRQLVVKMNASEPVRVQFNFINSAGMVVHRNTQVLQPGDNRVSLVLYSLPAGTYWAECISEEQKIFTKAFRAE